MLGLLFYSYASGVFSSRKIERATHEVIPFRFITGDMHPDHDTLRLSATISG
ncbi:MAG: transposase [Chloroflexi bacterium]|nr:transposase [Chloroflexota bacterium]